MACWVAVEHVCVVFVWRVTAQTVVSTSDHKVAPYYVGFTTFLWGDTQYCAVCWLCRYSRGGDGGFYRNNCHTLWACCAHVMCVGCDCKTLFLYVETTGRIKRQKAAGWLKNTAFKVKRWLARVSAVRFDFLLTACFKGSSSFHSLSSRRAMTVPPGPQTFCTHASHICLLHAFWQTEHMFTPTFSITSTLSSSDARWTPTQAWLQAFLPTPVPQLQHLLGPSPESRPGKQQRASNQEVRFGDSGSKMSHYPRQRMEYWWVKVPASLLMQTELPDLIIHISEWDLFFMCHQISWTCQYSFSFPQFSIFL